MNTKKPRKYKKNPEQKAKHKEFQRAWRLANPEKYAAINERRKRKLASIRPSIKTLPWWKRPLNKHWLRPIAEAMRRLGWTLDELAKRMQKKAPTVWRLISGQYYPIIEYQNEIQQVFASAGEYLDVLECWPQTNEPIPEEFNPHEESRNLSEHDTQIIESVLSELTKRERWVLKSRFFNGMTLEQVGVLDGTGRQRIRQIEAKALRKMRHPSRLKRIAELLFVY